MDSVDKKSDYMFVKSVQDLNPFSHINTSLVYPCHFDTLPGLHTYQLVNNMCNQDSKLKCHVNADLID